MAMMTTIGYGNIVTDNCGIIFTSMNATKSIALVMSDILEIMIIDMSKLTGIPIEMLIQDYVNEIGNNLIHEAIKSVAGIENKTTYTREIINKLLNNNS